MEKFKSYTHLPEKPSIPPRMKAVIMSKPGLENLKVAEIPTPEPNENQILVRVDACTICPSGLKLIAQGKEHPFLNGWDTEKYPIILGDEGAVTAVKIGKNLKDKYTVGEKLCIQPAVDHPPINYRERYRNPERMKKVAVGYTLGGHLAEYLLVGEEILEANCLLKLPSQEMGYYEISLSEPLSCVVSSQDHHVHLVINPETGERIPQKGLLKNGVTVIFGAGVMGKFHIELALSYQPREIIVFNRTLKRFDWIEKHLVPRARAKGINIHCRPLTLDHLPEIVSEITGQNYADDIIDATGSPEVQKAALSLLGKGSVFNAFAGLKVGESILPVDMRKVHYEETIITGSSGGNWNDTQKTLNLISKGDFKVGTQIKLVGDLDDAVDFLTLVKQQKLDGKAIVYPHTKLPQPIEVKEVWTREKEREHLEQYL